VQDANLVPKPIINTPQVTPPTPLETNTQSEQAIVSPALPPKERSGSAGKFTISTGFYADIDKIINPTMPPVEDISPDQMQPNSVSIIASSF
jgi:hypothetical protein